MSLVLPPVLTARPARWLLAAGGVMLLGLMLVGVWFLPGMLAPARPSTPLEPVAATAPADALDAPAESTSAEATAEPAVESAFAGIADPLPAPPRRTGLVTYTVEPGDALWSIAEQFQLRPETVLWANDLDNPDLLLIGQKLVIPPTDGVLYTVQPGDGLADIAVRYGLDVPTILGANNLSDPDLVEAGKDIFLPGARPLLRSGGATVQAAPGTTGDDQQSAALPSIPLPPNIDALLAASWLSADQTTTLYKTADPVTRALHELPAGARLERLDTVKNGRILVRDPGDGRTRQAMTGWVNAADLDVGRAPLPRELALAYPADTAMDISHVFAPYRSQLDGSPYAEANCGPTAIGMALGAFGVNVPARQLRAEALDAQHMWGNNVGTLLTALAQVVENHGLDTLDLRDGDGALHHWSVDDVRAQIQQGHPVVAQVRYRYLPGRGGAYYFGDHYILVTGEVPGGFLYNDPIDHDGIGWDRVMSADRLRTAMDASDRRYAYTAFAVAP